MNIRMACSIFCNITSSNYSLEEKAAAIARVSNMATHNSVPKDAMLEVIRWLLALLFISERSSERTNADAIRSMPDAALAAYLLSCDQGNFTIDLCDYCDSFPECNNDCSHAALKYLQQPAEVKSSENT